LKIEGLLRVPSEPDINEDDVDEGKLNEEIVIQNGMIIPLSKFTQKSIFLLQLNWKIVSLCPWMI